MPTVPGSDGLIADEAEAVTVAAQVCRLLPCYVLAAQILSYVSS